MTISKSFIPKHLRWDGTATFAKFDDLEAATVAPNPIEEWKKKRIGRITASRFADVDFKEVKCSLANKKSIITWLKSKNVECNEEMKLAELKALVKNTAGDKIVTPGTETYLNEICATEVIGEPLDSYSTFAMDWGNAHELEAIAHYEQYRNLTVDFTGTEQKFVIWKENNRIGATPDGFIGKKGLLEVKCPYNPTKHLTRLLTSKIEKQYMDQMFGQMLVTGREWVDFVSYDPRMPDTHKIWIKRIHRNNFQTEIDHLKNRLLFAAKELVARCKVIENYQVI